MNTATAAPMTKERAAEILYMIILCMLKKELEEGPITPTEKEEFMIGMKEDAPLFGITEDEMGSFVNFVCDDIERSCA